MPSASDETIRTYDAIHELYDAETQDFWNNFPIGIIEEYTQLLPGKEVIDLGSGPGRDALILRELGLVVTCVDGSEKMVEMTRRLGFKSIRVDMRDLNLEAGSYYGAWAYSSLIHLTFDESKELIRKISKFLRPGGMLFLGLIEGERNEKRPVGNSGFKRYFEFYTPEKVGELIDGSGFRIVSEEAYKPRNHNYLNFILKK